MVLLSFVWSPEVAVFNHLLTPYLLYLKDVSIGNVVDYVGRGLRLWDKGCVYEKME